MKSDCLSSTHKLGCSVLLKKLLLDLVIWISKESVKAEIGSAKSKVPDDHEIELQKSKEQINYPPAAD